jgi:hypothetical protein
LVLIALDFSRIGLAEADDVHSVSAISDDGDMKSSTHERHHPKPSFAEVPPVVLDCYCGFPVKVRDAIERQRTFGDISIVFVGIKRDPH